MMRVTTSAAFMDDSFHLARALLCLVTGRGPLGLYFHSFCFRGNVFMLIGHVCTLVCKVCMGKGTVDVDIRYMGKKVLRGGSRREMD